MNIPERFRADQQASDYPEFLYSLARQAKQHLPYLSIIISDTFSVSDIFSSLIRFVACDI
jgi:hypothetical protein